MESNGYQIVIVLPEENEKKSAVAQTSGDISPGKDKSSGGDSGGTDVMALAKSVVAYTGVVRIAEAYITHEINTVSLRTGATEYEEKLKFAYSEGMTAVNSVAAIAMGAAAGGVPGAIVAAVGVGINYMMKFINWSLNADKLEMQKSLEGISQSLMRSRMGLNGSRRGE